VHTGVVEKLNLKNIGVVEKLADRYGLQIGKQIGMVEIFGVVEKSVRLRNWKQHISYFLFQRFSTDLSHLHQLLRLFPELALPVLQRRVRPATHWYKTVSIPILVYDSQRQIYDSHGKT